MNLQDYVKQLRRGWLAIVVMTLLGAVGGVILTLLTTPLYQASTRLFVSTSSGSSVSEVYQGNRLSQERVISYAELLKGETLAQRTVDKLDLDMSAAQLKAHVSAAAKPDTVLIDVKVLDPSAVRARDIANTLSDEFVGLVRELETPSSGGPPDARVVVEQRASIPAQPVVPKPLRNIGGGVLVGLVLGVGLTILRDLLDNTVKSPETLEELTHVGTVGSIPLDRERRKQPSIAFDRDNSAIAEAFRKFRTNLQFLAVDRPPRVIVLTSSVPGEGKSTSSINLALALAEAEHSVVLVDADMRRPSVAKYLGLVGQVGFSSVLSGSATLDEALQETRFPGLTVLASGAVPPNPSELLGSQTARKLLDDLRSRFDYVVLDSTPLLAVTDAAVLAAGADGVLMVVRFGHTKRDQLTHAVSSLESVGASLLGAVFTMIPTRGAGSYSYNYTYYGSQGGRRTSASQRAQQQQTALKASTEGASSEEPETGAGVAPRLGGRRPREE